MRDQIGIRRIPDGFFDSHHIKKRVVSEAHVKGREKGVHGVKKKQETEKGEGVQGRSTGLLFMFKKDLARFTRWKISRVPEEERTKSVLTTF